MLWLFYIIFWLLILEGSIRKYIAPQLGAYIFFVRDPFLAGFYLLALQGGYFKKTDPLLGYAMLIAVISIPLWVVQSALYPVDKGLLLFVYGFRSYFAYVPLMFVLPRVFKEGDLRIFAYHVAIALFINAPLMASQGAVPRGHWLNAGIAEEESLKFKQLGVSGLRVRASGTFTTVVGTTNLTALAACFAFASWARPYAQRIYGPIFLYASFAAIVTSVAVAGSRSSVLVVGGVVFIGMLSALLLRGGAQRAKMLVLPPVLAVAAFIAYPILFPDAFKSFSARWIGANESEGGSAEFGWISRVIGGFTHGLHTYGEVPLTGFGLGLAGNAATLLGVTTVNGEPLPYTEVDWARQLVDLGPIVGTGYIVLRFVMAFTLVFRAYQATRRLSDALPLCLAAYAAEVISHEQITGNGTVGGFAWIAGGIALAAIARQGPHTIFNPKTTTAQAAPT